MATEAETIGKDHPSIAKVQVLSKKPATLNSGGSSADNLLEGNHASLAKGANARRSAVNFKETEKQLLAILTEPSSLAEEQRQLIFLREVENLGLDAATYWVLDTVLKMATTYPEFAVQDAAISTARALMKKAGFFQAALVERLESPGLFRGLYRYVFTVKKEGPDIGKLERMILHVFNVSEPFNGQQMMPATDARGLLQNLLVLGRMLDPDAMMGMVGVMTKLCKSLPVSSDILLDLAAAASSQSRAGSKLAFAALLGFRDRAAELPEMLEATLLPLLDFWSRVSDKEMALALLKGLGLSAGTPAILKVLATGRVSLRAEVHRKAARALRAIGKPATHPEVLNALQAVRVSSEFEKHQFWAKLALERMEAQAPALEMRTRRRAPVVKSPAAHRRWGLAEKKPSEPSSMGTATTAEAALDSPPSLGANPASSTLPGAAAEIPWTGSEVRVEQSPGNNGEEDQEPGGPGLAQDSVPCLGVLTPSDSRGGAGQFVLFSQGPTWGVIEERLASSLPERGLDAWLELLLRVDASFGDIVETVAAISSQASNGVSPTLLFDQLSTVLSQQLGSGVAPAHVVVVAAALAQVSEDYGLLSRLAELEDVALVLGKANPPGTEYSFTLRFPSADQMAAAVGVGVENAEVDLGASPSEVRIRELPDAAAADGGFELLVAVRLGPLGGQQDDSADGGSDVSGADRMENPQSELPLGALPTRSPGAWYLGAVREVLGGQRPPFLGAVREVPGGVTRPGPQKSTPVGVSHKQSTRAAPAGASSSQVAPQPSAPGTAAPSGGAGPGGASGGVAGGGTLKVQVNFRSREEVVEAPVPAPAHRQTANLDCSAILEFEELSGDAAKVTGKLSASVRPGEPIRDDRFACGYIQTQVVVEFKASDAPMFQGRHNTREDWTEMQLAQKRSNEATWGCGLQAVKYIGGNLTRGGKEGQEEAQSRSVRHLSGFEVVDDSHQSRGTVKSKSDLRFVREACSYSPTEPLVGSSAICQSYGARKYDTKMEGAWQLSGLGSEPFSIEVKQYLARDVREKEPSRLGSCFLGCSRPLRPHESVQKEYRVEFKVLRNVVPLLQATERAMVIYREGQQHTLFTWI